MSEQKTVFLDGFIFKRPKEGAPDFVKGELSIKVDEAIAFLQKNNKNGWINADLLASKDNTKLYFKLNTWEKPVDNAQPPVNTAPVNAGEDTRVAPAQEADIEMPPF
tara:strand:+ start:630 stop:950 length:321 start_codon:yes stop_codon:yes gene_type:complete